MAPKTRGGASPKSRTSRLTQVLVAVGILVGLLAPVVYLLEQNLESFYIFSIEELHDVSKRAVAAHGNDTAAMVNYIVAELDKNHPSHVNARWDDRSEWFFNNAGGAMGGMYIIHASITEYLIIFGTAVGTEGHSGRHTADDYFYILTGEEWAYVPGEFRPEVYTPGTVHHLPRGAVKQYRMPDKCFALEYARGWIPPMLFFGFADGFFSTLDFPTLWRTTYHTAREMGANLLVGKF
ncbi:ERG2/sigma1 receptor-like protein [Durotheca rogersii]|uniref:ERG2/sigma1 receptor-like protein n=1 Tax=Durotheca rogersii TaxID=419775 RepID=UPI00221E4853|nr:ERG2/sigma1 receptor-like protein [Durotheca rogersii]KAI5865510.1 ERG2/sigma1 receptor-like protein [Durotheca rogersii]